MKDAEIIKELEYQIEYECGQYRDIDLPTLKEAVNLINRLKAENERLKPLEENLDKLLYMLNAVDIGQIVLEEQKHTIKCEAYKEFAERLCADRVSNDPVVIAVKAELKEMG